MKLPTRSLGKKMLISIFLFSLSAFPKYKLKVGLDYLLKPGNEEEIVYKFELGNNYPNPFNPSTTITYQLANESNVVLKVFDVLGREVAELVNEKQNAGNHKIAFNAENLSSGIYIYRMKAGNFTANQKMLLIK